MGQRRDTVIVSRRVVLEPPRKKDFKDWAALRKKSRAHLEKWEPAWPKDANSKADWGRRVQSWKAGWSSRRAYVFLLRLLDDRRLIGGVSLTNVRSWPSNTASLGYWLGEEFEGQGYMQEGVAAVCEWAFSDLNLSRIEAGIIASNLRSRRVLESNGFEEEGHAKAYLEIAGKRRDHILFGLVRPAASL